MAVKKASKTRKGTRGTNAGSSAKSTVSNVISPKQWLAEVVKHDFSVDPEEHIFNHGSAVAIAESLKRFAQRNKNKKADTFQSAMSMLNFYINRAGKDLPDSRKEVLEDAKENLRQFFVQQDVRKA